MRPRVLFLLIIMLASCSTPAPQIDSAFTPLPASKPTKTARPTSTSIPGYADWSVFNPQAVDITTDQGALILTLKLHALWFMEQRGVLVYKLVSGNFRITAEVRTSKNSDWARPPGGDGSVQLGGLMIRDGGGGQENYVFIVIGDDGDGLSIESKNTVDGFSKYDGPRWDSSAAELRLCRFGQTIHVYKRHVASNEAWILADSFDRPDLPDRLQTGLNIYTDSKPDLRIRFDKIKIEPISTELDCTVD